MLARRVVRRLLSCSRLLTDQQVLLSQMLGRPVAENESRRPSLPTKNKDILILSPEETQDTRFKDFVREVNMKKTKHRPKKPVLRFLGADSDIGDKTANSILLFKPASASISTSKRSALVEELSGSFTKAQLVAYVREKDPAKKGISRATKRSLAGHIVERVWQVSESEAPQLEDLFVEEKVTLSQLELFLLLLSNGIILRHISTAVPKVRFSGSSDKLIMTGTPQQVENAKINLQHDLENFHSEIIDLGPIKKLAARMHGRFAVEEVGANTEVYFTKLHDDVYQLYTLSRSQLKRTKRLLLWLLNYNMHAADSLHLPADTSNVRMVPFKDDESLAWKDRRRNFCVMRSGDLQPASEGLSRELSVFSPEALSSVRLREETWADDRMSMQTVAEQRLDREWDLLTERDADPEREVKKTASELHVLEEQREEMFRNVTKLAYGGGVRGVGPEQKDEPMFTATLGRILVDAEHETVPTEVTEKPLCPASSPAFTFSTNIPLAHDHVLSLLPPVEDDYGVRPDPHVYSLQFKFMPSPFVDDAQAVGQTVEEHVQYPPVEMWVQLKGTLIPDVETLQIVTVEGENSAYLSLPHARSDVKMSCQQTGRLLEETEAETVEDTTENETNLDVSAMLESTIDRYKRFDSQRGVVEFLRQSQLDFSGKKPTSIAPHLDLVIGGKTVRYCYLNVSYRRELAVMADDHVLAHLTIVEGGTLGGKRVEVRFVGDYDHGASRENFDRLLNRVLAFIETL